MSDILDYIRQKLAAAPDLLASVEPVLRDARQTYGGDRVYICASDPNRPPCRRTIQRRNALRPGRPK